MAKEPAAQKAQLDSRPRTATKSLSRPKTRRIISLISSCVALVFVVCLVTGISVAKSNTDEDVDPFYDAFVATGESSSIVKRTPQAPFTRDGFTLPEIVENEFAAERWNGSWVSDTEYVYRNRGGALAIFSVVNGRSDVIVPANVMEEPRVFQFWLSPDQNYVLLAIRPQKLFRHSFIAIYDVYDIRNAQRIKLTLSPAQLKKLAPPGFPDGGPPDGFPSGPGGPPQGPPPQLPLMYATWSPKGSSLVYVFANNVFYRATPTSEDIPLSTSGIPGTIFNGVCDWVYEEEVISDTRAVWFSPDGSHVAWIEFNDTAVDLMPLEIYGQPGRLEFQYPIPTPLRYPKPGRTNPFVNVYVSRVDNPALGTSPILLPPPRYFDDKEKIIYSVTWATNAEVSLTWETRHQNYSLVSICNVNSASCKDSLVMTEPNGWMELDGAPVFTADGRQFAMILSSEGYKHVNVINRDTNQRVPITSGEMVVTDIYHWDENLHLIYFRATRIGSPGERHLYTVTDFESGQPGIVACISCDVVNTRDGLCGYNSFEFSIEKSYYTMSCKGPHVPQDYLFKTSPNKKIATLVTNELLSSALAEKNLPKISNLDIKIDGGKYDAKVRLYLPHDFNERKKYPLLVNVYAGPNSQQISDMFKLDWGTYLTTSEDIIYAVIDGRGSGFRGDDLLHELYYNLGTVEVQDQIDVTRQLLKRYSFLDKSKVAIWGWSYGGFVTLSALAADATPDPVFKCGIAVAPVSNWIYYDTIYAERYLGLPTPNDNARGYQNSDVTAKVEKLRGKKMLLVHGTADDNVHYQQTMMLTRALEEADVLFQQLTYPDENHGLVGLRKHFYHSLTNFILNDCFGKNQVLKK